MDHGLIAGFVMMKHMFQRHIHAPTQDLRRDTEAHITAVDGLAGAHVVVQ